MGSSAARDEFHGFLPECSDEVMHGGKLLKVYFIKNREICSICHVFNYLFARLGLSQREVSGVEIPADYHVVNAVLCNNLIFKK